MTRWLCKYSQLRIFRLSGWPDLKCQAESPLWESKDSFPLLTFGHNSQTSNRESWRSRWMFHRRPFDRALCSQLKALIFGADVDDSRVPSEEEKLHAKDLKTPNKRECLITKNDKLHPFTLKMHFAEMGFPAKINSNIMFYATLWAKPLLDPKPGNELTFKNNCINIILSKRYWVIQPINKGVALLTFHNHNFKVPQKTI